MNPSARQDRALTLVELLVVIAIIGLIASFVIPAVSNLATASHLSNATNQLAADLGYAQQLALKNNLPSQVIFYSYLDPARVQTAAECQAYQIWTQAPHQALNPKGVWLPASDVVATPTGITFSSDPTFTTIKSNPAAIAAVAFAGDIKVPAAATGNWSPASATGGAAADHTYFTVTFYPDGSTDLPDAAQSPNVGGWCLTLYPPRSTPAASNGSGKASGPTANFATLVIDAINGMVRVYRPG